VFDALRWGVLSAVAISAVGCSSETARFGEIPRGNQYAAGPGPVAAEPYQPPPGPGPVAGIERQPLPQLQTQLQYAPAQGVQGGPGGPPLAPRPEVTGAVRPAMGANWDWQGGTPVVVASGETVESLSHRYGVPSEAIMQANGISNPVSIVPGQRLVIPRYMVHGSGAKLAHAAAPRANSRPPATPVPAVAAASPPAGGGQAGAGGPQVHVVAGGDTLNKIARKYRIPVKELTVANNIQPDAPLKVGMKVTLPVRNAAPAKGLPAVAKPTVVAQVTPPPVLAPPKVNKLPPAAPAPVALAPAARMAATATPNAAHLATPVVDADETGGSAASVNGAPAFRWPARGRVINNFGAKVNGSSNDGIDLAMPEGTAVRAADDGVVAYAGSELKGYGNLVLVRHVNGFVTAYANASELMVKRNDQVHKGQVIAKSGQSGTAAAPQLHFEVRRNSSPVDPIQFLPSDKTASAGL
jgi:murein DD-endopeptidase MepM/ murein hydrolase activator NlpD